MHFPQLVLLTFAFNDDASLHQSLSVLYFETAVIICEASATVLNRGKRWYFLIPQFPAWCSSDKSREHDFGLNMLHSFSTSTAHILQEGVINFASIKTNCCTPLRINYQWIVNAVSNVVNWITRQLYFITLPCLMIVFVLLEIENRSDALGFKQKWGVSILNILLVFEIVLFLEFSSFQCFWN